MSPIEAALYEALPLAALPEELMRLPVVGLYSASRSAFDEPMQGMVYGATAALGFPALENTWYIWQGGWTTAGSFAPSFSCPFTRPPERCYGTSSRRRSSVTAELLRSSEASRRPSASTACTTSGCWPPWHCLPT
jgi:hypothetical protein